METTCPRCGKVIVVSSEEVAVREGVVVCPQCLAVFDMDGNLHTSQPRHVTRSVSEQPDKRQQQPEARRDDNTTEPFLYCPECGKPLPGGINFCPYCGIALAAETTAHTTPSQPARQEQPAATAPAATTRSKPAPAAQWTPVITTLHYQPNKWGTEPANTRTLAAGYTVIAALLVLLVFIIYKGLLIAG